MSHKRNTDTTPTPMDYANKRYNEHYKFHKNEVRSPGSKWDQEMAYEKAGYEFESMTEAEKALVAGKTHGYGHNIGQRKGYLRTSGSKGAHQLGKK